MAKYGNLHESRVQLSVERLCRFTIQTASALEHLEKKNIIHPSVNLFNCLVVSEDEVSTVCTGGSVAEWSAPDLKSGDPELGLGLGATLRVPLYIANWYSSYQLGFLIC